MDNTELAPGTVFADRFIVERVAGKGGMGVVYRACDRQCSGATVALKVLHPFANRRFFLERFCREAYMLSELRHPGIVSYVDHGISERGRAFLAMEWLDGEDLDERLDRCGLTLLETVSMFRGIADALSVAHRRGFVHRDLKPENIFLRHGLPARATLLDFGVGRIMASELTGAGHAVGTPLYMAPEQARGDRNVGPSADVFALGCLMYTCLTGLIPLVADQAAIELPSVLLDDLPNLREVRPDSPEKLDRLLQRMLEKDPARRPKDAGALLEELNALGPLEDRPPEHARHSRTSSLPSQETEVMRLVSVISVLEERSPANERSLDDPTLDEKFRALGDTLRDRFDARIEHLPGGSMRVTLAQTERTTATDQCVQAARCSLFLRGRFPSRRVVITTVPVVMAEHQMPNREAPAGTSDWPGIYLDAMTAHLLDDRFQMRAADSGFFVLDSELTIDDVDCDDLGAYELVSGTFPLLHRGSVDWCNAVGTMVVAMLSSLHRYDEALEWGEVLRTTDPESDAVGAYVESLRTLSGMLTLFWRREQVQAYLARMESIVETSDSLSVRGSWEFAQAHTGWFLSRDPWSASIAAARAEALFETVSHRRHLTKARLYRGVSLAHLGIIDAGEEKLRTARADALRDGDTFTNGVATLQLAMTLVDKEDAGALEEAEQMLRSHLEYPGDDNLTAFANAILGQVFLDRGALDSAEHHLGQALDKLVDFVALRPYADAARVKLSLRRGRNAEAREYASAALTRLDRLGGGGFAEVRLKLAAFEAYAAAGDHTAERILESVIEQIGIRADAIGDSSARMRFLTTNPVNRRALEVAYARSHRRSSLRAAAMA